MPSSYVIGDHFENFIKSQLESGRYNSASEVIREALRLFEEQEELRSFRLKAMRQQIVDGMNSGVAESGETVFNRLETKYAFMIEES